MKERKILIVTVLGLVLMTVLALVVCADGARWPADPGKNVKKNGKLRVDIATAEDGYIQVSIKSKSSKKMKLRITKGKEALTYDLNNKGEYEIFPLQLGNGKYEVALYENIKGKSYSAAGSVTVNAKMADPESCFYYPNQYVNYNKDTAAVAEAEKICKDKDRNQSYEAICSYMKNNFVYDYIKAINIKSGMLPDIDEAWSKHMGICQDLSAIMCCMLRTQGFPARMMIGMADKTYHAWVEVKFNNEDHFFDPTVAVSGLSNVKNYTVERFY